MLKKTEAEAAKGWLGEVVPLTREHVQRYNLSRRMAVEEYRPAECAPPTRRGYA